MVLINKDVGQDGAAAARLVHVPFAQRPVRDARAGDYRTTTYLQYKSVLKHAGLLAPGRLGGTSSTSYVPEA